MPERPVSGRPGRELPDLPALTSGDKAAWEGFIRRYSALVAAAVRSMALRSPGVGTADIEDLVQEVFFRLCKDDFRLLRSYDPSRAGITTWLTIVARSAARDATRRRRLDSIDLGSAPESALATMPAEPRERITIPDGLLSPRQNEVLTLLYDREMTVTEVAAALAIDPQTVRSMHHKAMLKLRAHFDIKNANKK